MARRMVSSDHSSGSNSINSVVQKAASFREEQERISRLSPEEQQNLVSELSIESLEPFSENEDVFGADEDQIRETARSIEKTGFWGAIWVMPDPENTGKYIIIAGHQRWMAAKKAGKTTIPAFIYHDLTPETVYRMWIDSNQLQRKSTPYAKYKLILSARRHILERQSVDDPDYLNCNLYEKISEITHIPKASISRCERLGKMPPYTKECCKSESFPYLSVLPVAKMSEVQKEAFDIELKNYMDQINRDDDIPDSDQIKLLIRKVQSGDSDAFESPVQKKNKKSSYSSLPEEAKELYKQATRNLESEYDQYAVEKQHKHEESCVDNTIKDLAIQMNYCLENKKAIVVDPKSITASIQMMEDCIKKLKKYNGVY